MPVDSAITGQKTRPSLGEIATDAIRYWEPLRLLYNAILAVIVVANYFLVASHAQPALTMGTLLGFFVRAMLANVLYCAAYLPDVFVQLSSFRDLWLRLRWILLVLGILFASAIAQVSAMTMFDPTLRK